MFQQVTAGELTFDVDIAGPPDGDVVFLLHGFPQRASAWATVGAELQATGYRTVAPDQRGYSPSARPRGVSAYRLPHLTGDVVAIADALGVDRFHVVGHDWGAVVAWALAAWHPDRVATVASVSVPHPLAYREALLRSLQVLRSLYVGFFVLPLVPERILGAGRAGVLRRLLERSGLPRQQAASYAAAASEPAALTAALNWYRAAVRSGLSDVGPVDIPALLVWSDGDTALDRRGIEGTGRHVHSPYRLEILEGVSHWIPETAGDRLTPLLLDHLTMAASRR